MVASLIRAGWRKAGKTKKGGQIWKKGNIKRSASGARAYDKRGGKLTKGQKRKFNARIDQRIDKMKADERGRRKRINDARKAAKRISKDPKADRLVRNTAKKEKKRLTKELKESQKLGKRVNKVDAKVAQRRVDKATSVFEGGTGGLMQDRRALRRAARDGSRSEVRKILTRLVNDQQKRLKTKAPGLRQKTAAEKKALVQKYMDRVFA